MNQKPDSNDIKQQVRRHVSIFIALIIFTFITVGASYVHIESTKATVAFALAVSLVEAFLVAGFMMHLLGEKKTILVILVATVFFFAALMYLVVWTTQPGNRLHFH